MLVGFSSSAAKTTCPFDVLAFGAVHLAFGVGAPFGVSAQAAKHLGLVLNSCCCDPPCTFACYPQLCICQSLLSQNWKSSRLLKNVEYSVRHCIAGNWGGGWGTLSSSEMAFSCLAFLFPFKQIRKVTFFEFALVIFAVYWQSLLLFYGLCSMHFLQVCLGFKEANSERM